MYSISNFLDICNYGKYSGEVPTFVVGHGGHPERDVEGAVPYKGAVEMVRCHRRGDSLIARGGLIASPTIKRSYGERGHGGVDS